MTNPLHRGDLGMQRARIAPLLTGEELAELLALAELTIVCGGSLCFMKPSPLSVGLKKMRLVKWETPPDLSRGTKLHSLTDLGWLTLLTRAKNEMCHLLPAEESDDSMAA